MKNKETLEEFIQKSYPKTDSHYDFTVTSKIRNGIRLGAKWKQEQDKKLYSEEDMIEFVKFILLGNHEYKSYENMVKEWFEEFKKK